MTSKGIRWCKECGVPLLEEFCRSCGSKGKYFTIDLKPVFDKEREMFEDFLSIELPETLVRWKNRIMYDGKTLFRFKTDFKKLKLFAVEPKDKIKERINGSSSESWREFINRTVKYNDEILREKERASIDFIKETSKKYPENLKVVSFGGGKDSVVVSLLAEKALKNVPLFFADTTLEYPETYEFIEQYAKKYKCELVKEDDGTYYSSDQDFFEICEKLGPPSIRYRWCCYVFKAYSVGKFYETLKEKALAFSGIRRAESLSRKKYPAIKEEGGKIARQILAHPIIDWKEADVWFYLLREDALNNPLYEMGHMRVGCWPCPNTGPSMCFYRKLTHPHLWNKMEKVLKSYAKKMEEPKDWIDNHLWRLRTPGRNKMVVTPSEVRKDNGRFKLHYNVPLNVHALEHLKPLGKLNVRKNNGSYKYSVGSHSFSVNGEIKDEKTNLVLACKNQGYIESKVLFEKLLTRAINCIGCGGCVSSCPNGAMDVSKGYLTIDTKKCNRCGKCAKSNCMALKFAMNRTLIKANLFKMSPCMEGEPMNHVTIPDAMIGNGFSEILKTKGIGFEIHEGGKVVCVSDEISKDEVEKMFWGFINQQKNQQTQKLIKSKVNN